MCEYCGCQESVRAIADLTAEHDLVVDLSGRAEVALAVGDRERAADLARQIAAVLVAHTAVEERGVFPPLADEFPDHVEGLQEEHRAIEDVLGEAAGGVPSDLGWDERLLDALAVLRAHVLKEQDGVLPAALSRLDPEDWDRVDGIRSEFDRRLSPAT